jgi:hypothetical protein
LTVVLRGIKWFSFSPYVSENIMAFPADLEIIAFEGKARKDASRQNSEVCFPVQKSECTFHYM